MRVVGTIAFCLSALLAGGAEFRQGAEPDANAPWTAKAAAPALESLQNDKDPTVAFIAKLALRKVKAGS